MEPVFWEPLGAVLAASWDVLAAAWARLGPVLGRFGVDLGVQNHNISLALISFSENQVFEKDEA